MIIKFVSKCIHNGIPILLPINTKLFFLKYENVIDKYSHYFYYILLIWTNMDIKIILIYVLRLCIKKSQCSEIDCYIAYICCYLIEKMDMSSILQIVVHVPMSISQYFTCSMVILSKTLVLRLETSLSINAVYSSYG